MRRQVKAQVVRVLGQRRVGEQVLRRRLQAHQHLAGRQRQALARTQVPGHAAPAPGIDVHTQGAEGLDIGVIGDLRCIPIAQVLAAQDVIGAQGPHRGEDIGLVAVHGLEVAARRWLHRQQRDDLEQVALHHVTQTARAFVEGTTATDAELLGQRDLHAGHMVAIPDRLEKGIREAEVEEIHDRFLAQEVIDAEDRVFCKGVPRDAVEFACRGQVTAEGFLDDDPPAFAQRRALEALNHRRKQRWRNGQVERRPPRAAQGEAQRIEGGRVLVIAADVVQRRQEAFECAGRHVDAGLPDAGTGSSAQLLIAQLRCRDADHRHVQRASTLHGAERREDLLVRQVARGAEHDQCVGALGLRIHAIGNHFMFHQRAPRRLLPGRQRRPVLNWRQVC